MNRLTFLTPSRSSRLLAAFLCCLSIFAIYGCNNNDELEDDRARQLEAYNRQLAIDTVIIKNYIAGQNITNAKRSPYKSGMFYAVQTPGTGDTAVLGKTMVTHYVLLNLQGDTLDTSRKLRAGQTVIQPLTFQLGNANLISGYQEGVSLLRVGKRAKFFLPSGLAYGTQGSGTAIPANTVLIFDIELLQVR